MPDLVLDAPSGSLLDNTNRLIVRRQIGYGEERGVPWGISEAAYNARDVNFTYQYSNFGISGLGLKRGLSEDLVVAPYATALAAMVDPVAASANFRRLASVGALGRYGFYESIDYTASRLPEGETREVVKAYMAHHQGMTIVSLANVLLGETMRRRFGAEPAVRATELLAPGAHSHHGGRRARDLRRRADRFARAGRGAARSAALPFAPRSDAAHAHPFQRPLLGDDDGGRLRLQPLARPRRDPVARGRDPRPVGNVRLPGRRDVGQGLVGGIPAGRRRARRLRGGLLGRPHRDPPHRQPDLDGPPRRRLDGGRRRDPAGVSDEPRIAAPRDRGHVLRRDRSRARSRRRGAPGVLESLRGDRVRRAARGARRRPPAARPRAARLGRAGDDRRRRDGRHGSVRDRSGPFSRARAQRPGSDLDRRAPPAVQHRRHGARSRLQPASPRAPGPRGDGARPPGDGRRRLARGRSGARRKVPRPGDVRARLEPRLDAGPGPAAPPRDLDRRGAPLPAAGGAHPVFRRRPAGPHRDPGAKPPGTVGALGARHLRRRPDRARAHRPGGGPGHRAAAAARPRVLEAEGPRGRSRDRQRTAAVVFARARRDAGIAGARGQPRTRSCRRAVERAHLRAARRARIARGTRRARRGRPRGPAVAPGNARATGHPAAAPGPGGAGRAARRGAAAGGAPASAADPARLLQRPGRLRAGHGRVRHPARRASVDAGPVDQCPRQSVVRMPRLGGGLRLHVGRQQPRESADPLVERSGRRSTGRGRVPARRGDGRGLESDAAAHPRRRVVRRAPRPGLQPLRVRAPGRRERAHRLRGRAGPGQDLAPAGREPDRLGAEPHRDGLRGVGSRPVEGGRRAVRRDRARLRDGRDLRAQRLERNPGRARGLRRRGRPAGCVDGRPHRVPRAQRRPGRAGGAGARRHPVAAHGRGARPVRRRCRCGCGWRRDRARKSSSCSARAAMRTRPGVSSPVIGPGIPRLRSPSCGESGKTR